MISIKMALALIIHFTQIKSQKRAVRLIYDAPIHFTSMHELRGHKRDRDRVLKMLCTKPFNQMIYATYLKLDSN